MRVAAVYDIHGNLPALEAVLAEVEAENPDLIVVGGDVAFGPMPSETTDRLRALGDCARFIMGNTDRALIEAFDLRATPTDTDDPLDRGAYWAAQRLSQSHRDFMAGFAPRLELEIEGYGSVLFATARREATKTASPRGQAMTGCVQCWPELSNPPSCAATPTISSTGTPLESGS